MLSQQRVPNEIGREREYLLPQSEGIVLAIMFRLATSSFIHSLYELLQTKQIHGLTSLVVAMPGFSIFIRDISRAESPSMWG